MHAVEKMRTREKEGRAQTLATPHTNTYPPLSLQSGLAAQEAACMSKRSNVCVCVELNTAALESRRDVYD